MVVPPLKTLSTLVDNLVQNPFEDKYWKLKKSNKSIQEKILQFPEILEVIKILGFEDEDDTMQIKFGNTNLFSSVQSGIMEII